MAAAAAVINRARSSPSSRSARSVGLQLTMPASPTQEKFTPRSSQGCSSLRTGSTLALTARTFQKSRTEKSLALSAESLEADPENLRCTTTATGLSRKRNSESFSSTFGERHFPRLTCLVKSRQFEASIGFVILVNCITMGLEAELLVGGAEGSEAFLSIAEHVITAIFLVEFLLRCTAYGWRIYLPAPGQLWNFFDAMLVLLTGVVTVWVLPLLGAPSGSTFQTLTVLRALRLARLVRVVQSVEWFHEVWLLLRGLMESGRVLFWTVVVIFLITYIFAVFGVVLLGTKIKEKHEDVLAEVGSEDQELAFLVTVTDGVLPLMYTLIQVLTLDSWNSIARPMMKHIPWSWSFFYLYISIAVIVMMNLVTAVIVENALKNSQQDAAELMQQREKEKEMKLAHFQRVFEELDMDGDGELSWQEFECAFEDPELSKELRLLGIDAENCREIFELLDDGDGVLTPKVFFQGLSRMDGNAHAKDLLRTSKMTDLTLKLMRQQSMELQEDVGELLRHTPGAILRERTGSLRSRACKRHRDDGLLQGLVSRTTTPTTATPRATKMGTYPPASVSPEPPTTVAHPSECAPVELGLVLRRLEEVAGMVLETRHDFKQFKDEVDMCVKGVETCSERLSLLSMDLSELKLGQARASTSDAFGLLCGEGLLSEPSRAPRSQWRNQISAAARHLRVPEKQPLAVQAECEFIDRS